MRERLPDERSGVTHHFAIMYAPTPLDGAEGSVELEEIDGYITVNTYPDDGRVGEVFVRISKMGETISGLMDGIATTMSVALQSRAELKRLCAKYIATRFVPNGPTSNPEIPRCTSILDYIGRWIGLRYLTLLEQVEIGLKPLSALPAEEQASATELTSPEQALDNIIALPAKGDPQ